MKLEPASILGLVFVLASGKLPAGDPRSLRPVDFQRDIRPLLSDRCFGCHGPDAKARKADLRLDLRDGALGARGVKPAVIVPGDASGSELVRRITNSDPDERMPPSEAKKQLAPGEIELIRRWVAEGARWTEHWSLVPPIRAPVPAVHSPGWPHNPVDSFILARLEREGLTPSSEADRRTLARRLSFDLLGLPPSIEDVEAFLADDSPDAFERLADRLLASPHHGERLAVLWLDLVRYADTVGYHGDQDVSVSPYRDYVIRAFNEQKPFDEFTVEQLAGDLLPGSTLEQKVASGYNRLNKTTEEGGAQAGEYLVKYAADRVRTTAGVWMGATLGCAECHDHKYDPYRQRDFYTFAAFFADLDEAGVYKAVGQRPPEVSVPTAEQAAELARLDAEIAKGRQELKAEREKLLKQCRTTLVSAAVAPKTVRVLHRGDWQDTSGEVVEPAVPSTFANFEVGARRATRLDLARWLVSPGQPQAARVLSNRLWKLCFGTGISRVLDDLGSQGEFPVHPELLDRLAVELVESGWSIRHVLRQIVHSSAYRQSSAGTQRLTEVDPQNRLVARQSRFRLEAEMVRDAALAVSGLLVHKLGGRSVKPYQPDGYYAHLNFPLRTYASERGPEQYRRGVYMHWQRLFLHPMLLAFDAPSREECSAERPISNTPRSALALLNDPTFVEAARVFAERILRLESSDPVVRIEWAFRRALAREPAAHEAALLAGLASRQLDRFARDPQAARALIATGNYRVPADLDPALLAAWTMAARAILNLSEFITRE